MANNLVTEAYLAANFTPKSGITPGTDDHVILNCTEIIARYWVSVSPSTGNYCPKQSELSADNQLLVGDAYAGGIIGYIFVPGDTGYVSGEIHGLIICSSDLGQAQWCHVNGNVSGASGTSIGTGQQNTIDICNFDTGDTSNAAWTCANLSYGGYSDWFLASKDELAKLYLSYANGSLSQWFGSDYYWSSSEVEGWTSYAWSQSFASGIQSQITKGTYDRVCAIRYF